MQKRPKKPVRLILVLTSFIFLISPWDGQSNPSSTQDSPGNYNVILIDVTCLRADHLSSYGYFRKTSPFIDQWAAKDIWFTQAISQAYWTLPSVASILTSKYPATHNVLSRNQKLNDDQVTITEILKENGYRTAAFVGGLDLDSIHNLNQGFEVYYKETGENPTGSFSKNFPKAIAWLKENKNNKFFLYVQGYDAHPPFDHIQPYDSDYQGVIRGARLEYQFLKGINNNKFMLDNKEVELSKKDIDYIIAHYDGGISYVDKLLAEFIKELARLELINKTIIVVFGDHGEELSDHGSFDRFGKQNLYEEVVHVPLVIKHPRIKGVKINQPVELIDITPTILGFLKLPPVKDMQGKNLLPLIRDDVPQSPDKHVFGGWENKQMVRSSEWKLILLGKDFELYNLKKDPGETKNLIKQNPQKAAELSKRLFDWFIKTRFKGDANSLVIPQNELPEFYQRLDKKKEIYTTE